MARGQRKSLETKVEEKQGIIQALEIRLEKEKEELHYLLQEQENEQLRILSCMISDANLTFEEVQNILTNYTPASA